LDLPALSTELPFYPNVFAIQLRGHIPVRLLEGRVAGDQTYPAMSSLQPGWIRPGSL